MSEFQKWKLSSIIPMVLLSAAAVTTVVQMQMQQIESFQDSASFNAKNSFQDEDRLQQKLLVLKRSPSFGFENLVAGGVFLNFLQYFSDAQTGTGPKNDLSSEFFDVIITLDPFDRDYYLFLAGSTTLYAGEPKKTVDLMGEGLSKMNSQNAPNDAFYIWRYKAVEELLFLGDGQAAKDSFENAAEWAAQSNRFDSDLMEDLSRQTAKFLKKDPDSLFAQIAAWESVVSSALNNDIKEKATQRVEELTAALQAQSNPQNQSTSQDKKDLGTVNNNND